VLVFVRLLAYRRVFVLRRVYFFHRLSAEQRSGLRSRRKGRNALRLHFVPLRARTDSHRGEMDNLEENGIGDMIHHRAK